jgi:hypothetical protein
MPLMLTTGAVVTCPHGGVGTSTSTNAIVTITGMTALVEGDMGVLACPLLPWPCVGYTLKSMGLNATTIGGKKAILATDFQQSQTGLPLTIVETQTITRDDTLPGGGAGAGVGGGAGVGAGGAAGGAAGGGMASGAPAPTPPELLDMVKPIVTVSPAALAFDGTTQLPPVAPVIFSLTTDHPLEWQLRLINPVQKYDLDLTDGTTPGAAVMPAGGGWSTTTLTVTLTLTAVFMAALGKTTPTTLHEFYCTGISRRGLSANAVMKLTVT